MITKCTRAFGLLAVAGLVLWSGAAALALGGAATDPDSRVVTHGSPVTLCLEPGPALREDLVQGTRRPVLAVIAYRPGDGSPPTLEVTAQDTGETTRIGLFPGVAFEAETPQEARRFFLPAANGAGTGEACFVVRLESDEPRTAGTVTVRLEVSQSLEER
ncbi:MAG: hypothetical protein GVY13_04760 [Alphaproteobacteria bacterium]|jgi:hypothetical protein|nr:hypothetical protein [Alphaproteobacteria bacterium]